MEALGILLGLFIVWSIFYDKLMANIKYPTEESESNKIDITNNRVTKPTVETFKAHYNERRKSQWKVPTKQSDIINYDEYINSPEWLDSSVRRSKLISTNGNCEACAHKGNHVHHITYTNLGKESVDDLAFLCTACHEYTHKMAGKGAGYYPPLQCPSTK